MKRIIDVDENLIYEGFIRNFTEEEKDVLINAVRYSTPYNQTSVLTDAEKIICKMYLKDLDKFHTCNEYKILMNLIDNAQVSDNIKCPFCGKELTGTDLNFCYKCGAKLNGGT